MSLWLSRVVSLTRESGRATRDHVVEFDGHYSAPSALVQNGMSICSCGEPAKVAFQAEIWNSSNLWILSTDLYTVYLVHNQTVPSRRPFSPTSKHTTRCHHPTRTPPKLEWFWASKTDSGSGETASKKMSQPSSTEAPVLTPQFCFDERQLRGI